MYEVGSLCVRFYKTASLGPHGLQRPTQSLGMMENAAGLPATMAEALTVRMNFMRQAVVAVVAVDGQEHRRRKNLGLGGRRLGNFELLRNLATLPYGQPVPKPGWCSDGSVRSGSLAACLDLTMTGFVVRTALVPVEPIEIMISGKSWQRALRKAMVLSQYGPCAVLLDSKPKDVSWVSAQARYWGVGLEIHGPEQSDVEQLVEPEEFRPSRFTGASWHFAELAYESAVATWASQSTQPCPQVGGRRDFLLDPLA